MKVEELSASWQRRAAELQRYAPAAAEAFLTAARDLEEALRAGEDEELTLAQASRESGYAERTLREKLARGDIPNRGQRHRPRIKRADLPRRVSRPKTAGWDPDSHVGAIVRRP